MVAPGLETPERVIQHVREEMKRKIVQKIGLREDRADVLPRELLDPGVLEDVDGVVPVQELVGAGAPERRAAACEQSGPGEKDPGSRHGPGRLIRRGTSRSRTRSLRRVGGTFTRTLAQTRPCPARRATHSRVPPRPSDASRRAKRSEERRV